MDILRFSFIADVVRDNEYLRSTQKMARAYSKYFSVSLENDLEFLCLIASCKKRVLVSKSNKSTNLKRHLQTHHPDTQIVVEESNEKMCYEMKKRMLLQACVELVTAVIGVG